MLKNEDRTRTRRRGWTLLTFAVICLAAPDRPSCASGLTTELTRALETSPYVYIQTQRKDGSFGTPAEIWFMYDQGAVWMASPATTWRVKRIRAGRPAARIAVGTKDGPSFAATGSIVRDPAAYERLYTTFAKKYPEGWPKYEARFREGLKDDSRVLMRYQPAAAPAPAVTPGRESPRSSPGR